MKVNKKPFVGIGFFKFPNRLLIYSLLLILFVAGVFLSLTSNYGSDNDAYGILRTYLQLKGGEGYVPSRFTGYPVAEIGIGFIAFHFGSWLTNLVSFLFLLISSILIYKSLLEPESNFNLVTFIVLVLSSPLLFFDNISAMDYSWALLFFSLGLFSLKRNNLLFSALFFGLSIGARPNFLFFCVVAVIFYKPEIQISNSLKFSMIFLTSFIGSLFYVPIWFNSSLEFDWLTAVRPLGQGYEGLIARFVYKSWMAVGLLAFPLALYLIYKFRQSIVSEKNFKVISILIICNLLIYLYIPADRSYLQLALILLFLIISLNPTRSIFVLVGLNLFSWFVTINPVTIIFKSNNPCVSIEAVGVKFKPNLGKGELFIFKERQNEVSCYHDEILSNLDKLKSGSRLK